jgi:hypothetical protein
MGGRHSRRIRGGIGEQIFAEVEQLTADGKTKRMEAFKQIASKTGGQPGTVAANYYRIARKRGGPLRARRGTGRGITKSKGALEAVVAAIRKLESVLEAQEQEKAALQKDNRRFEKLRRLLRA